MQLREYACLKHRLIRYLIIQMCGTARVSSWRRATCADRDPYFEEYGGEHNEKGSPEGLPFS